MTTPTITAREKALAAQVVLPMTHLDETPGLCPAWVASKGARCLKPATDGLLCKWHHTAAERRLNARTAQREAEAEGRAANARVTVDRAPIILALAAEHDAKAEAAEAQISSGGDRAAYGGAVHPVIEKRQHAANERDAKFAAIAAAHRRAAARYRDQVERARREVNA